MLEHFRECRWSASDKTGTAMLFERRGRDRGASSADAENVRDLWREKTDLSEKADRGINNETGPAKPSNNKGRNAMFDKMKAMFQMQQKMRELKEELENTDFEVLSPDNLVKIKMSAAQEVKEVNILTDLEAIEKTILEKAIKDVYNRAIKRCQDLATEKMKAVTGFNLPGLT